MISVIDCQMGNIGSVVNMFKHVGHQVQVISTVEEVQKAEKIVLPGIGSWDSGAKKLNNSGLKSAILDAISERNIPFMGICLGMQLLFDSSEEGAHKGLGLIPGHIKQFDFKELSEELMTGPRRLRIPHMGWNIVKPCREKDPILSGLTDEICFYFVHSFHATEVPADYQLLTCDYGYDFVCAVNKSNVWGFQFHPEKSHRFGMQVFRNFAEAL